MVRRLLPQQGFGIRHRLAPGRGMAAGALERAQARTAAEEPDHPGPQHDQRERQVEQEDRGEGRRRDADHDAVLQRLGAYPDHRLKDDGEHRRLEAEEQRRHQRDVAQARIDPAQRHDRYDAGQHEQHAGDQPAERPVHQPADIDGKLLGFGSRQQHAVVQRVQEPGLADPAQLFHQHPVHHGDLSGGTAEAQQADPQPDPQRLGQGNAVAGWPGRSGDGRNVGHDRECPWRCDRVSEAMPETGSVCNGRLWPLTIA